MVNKQEIYDALRDVFCEIYFIGDEVEIEIEYGDWKHDHLYTDKVMEELGYKKTSEDVFDDGDGDSYSSTHYYELNK